MQEVYYYQYLKQIKLFRNQIYLSRAKARYEPSAQKDVKSQALVKKVKASTETITKNR